MNKSEYLKEKVQRYKSCVCTFCYYMALISLISERVERGCLTDKQALTNALVEAEKYKMRFLQSRADLGLSSNEDAFDAFVEDFSFAGFEISGGKFRGDRERVEAVAGKWDLPIGKIPEEDEAVRYEVSMYCLMLAGGAQHVFVALCEDEAALTEDFVQKRNSRKGFWHKLLSGIKCFFTGNYGEHCKRRYLWESAWEEA